MVFNIVGCTDSTEVFMACSDRKFLMNEYIVIEDKHHGNIIGEVVESHSFNKFIPMVDEKNHIWDDVVALNLEMAGFDIENNTVNLAKVRIIEELPAPVTVGSVARLPEFPEIENILIKKRPAQGWLLGVIRGTADLQEKLPPELSCVAPLFERDKGVMGQCGVPFVFNYHGLYENPHMAFLGGSGGGKSIGLRDFMEEAMLKKIPGLAFDPHYELSFDEPFIGLPAQYQHDFKKQSVIATVGKDVGVNFEDLSSDELVGLLSTHKYVTDTMEMAIKRLHENKDSLTTFKKRIERLLSAFENIREIEGKAADGDKNAEKTLALYNKYKNDISGLATLKGIAWRLNALEYEGLFQHGISLIEESMLRCKMVVLQGSTGLLKSFAGYVINALYKKRRNYRDMMQKDQEDLRGKNINKFPPFLLILDEAHIFATKGDIMNPTKWVIREIAQEGRKYGINLVLASQRPALLDDTTIGLVNTKIIFRTTRKSDLDTISEETDLSGIELKRLPFLNSGNAYISSSILGRSVAIRFRVPKTNSPHNENPFDELGEFDEGIKLRSILMDKLPIGDDNLFLMHDKICREMGRRVQHQEIKDTLQEMYEMVLINVESSPLGETYKRRDTLPANNDEVG